MKGKYIPMLPVSGAEQLRTSEPKCPDRPMSSAITAYCPDEQWLRIFANITYLQICERDTVLRIMSLWEEEVPEPESLRFHLELLNDGNNSLPALDRVRRQLFMGYSGRRKDFILLSKWWGYNLRALSHSFTSRKVISLERVSRAKGENLSSTCTDEISLLLNPYRRETYHVPWRLRCILNNGMLGHFG
jgi:hypothetical protein